MPRTAGHIEGSRRAAEAVEACRELGVKVSGQRNPVAATYHLTVLLVVVRFALAV